MPAWLSMDVVCPMKRSPCSTNNCKRRIGFLPERVPCKQSSPSFPSWNSRTREWKRQLPLTSPVRPVPLLWGGVSFLQQRPGQDRLPRSRWPSEPTCSRAGDASPDHAVQMRRWCFRLRQERQERFGAFSLSYGTSSVSLSSDKTTATMDILSRHPACLRSHVSGRQSLLSVFPFVHVLHFTRPA
jgi:hypothetical protein